MPGAQSLEPLVCFLLSILCLHVQPEATQPEPLPRPGSSLSDERQRYLSAALCGACALEHWPGVCPGGCAHLPWPLPLALTGPDLLVCHVERAPMSCLPLYADAAQDGPSVNERSP